MRIALAALLALTSAAHAQAIMWGVTGGLTSAKLVGSNGSNHSRGGMSGGVSWAIELSPHIAVGVEASYVEKGGRAYFPDDLVAGTDLRLAYYETPVFVRVSKSMEGNGQKPFFRAGFAVGEEARCRTALARCGSDRRKYDDFGLLAGVGTVLRHGPGELTLEFRHTEGRRRFDGLSVRSRTSALLISTAVRSQREAWDR